MKDFFIKYWFVVTLTVAFLLRLPSLFEPFTYGDEGVYLTLGLGIRKGLILYKDIYDNKPPLIYLLSAIAGTFRAYRLIYFGWGLITIIAFKKLAETIFSKKYFAVIATVAFSIFSSIHTFEGNIANAENFFIIFTILGALCLISRNRKKTKIALNTKLLDWFLSGLMFSLATLFKFPAFFDIFAILFFCLVYWVKSRKNFYWKGILFFSLGIIIPWGLFCIYFAANNALSQFIQSALLQNIPYLSSWGAKSTGSIISVYSLPGRMVIFLAILLAIFFSKKIITNKLTLLLIWFFATLFAALLSGRPYPHYLIQTLPPACLLFVFVFSRRTIGKVAGIIPLLLIPTVMVVFKYYGYNNFSYYNSFIRYATKGISQQKYYNYFNSKQADIYNTAAYINRHTQQNDRIFVWGDDPYIYSIADRLPIGKYTVAYHIIDLKAYQETINSLEKLPPKYIVINTDTTKPFPELQKIINSRYFFITSFQNYSIFGKR